MIKKVIVFTDDLEPTDSRIWDVQYDALRSYFEKIRSKFRDKGYGDDAVPHILYLERASLDLYTTSRLHDHDLNAPIACPVLCRRPMSSLEPKAHHAS
ncbi:unnamed protein product [Prunus armeniaca]|uniref:Uncharacterized protein n=1 Tax=Prunus armeniaca TaxID=36596 RepID=A0A6J5UYI9_PRUAR|nr:unnamed protein product [Prunus armeniaca]CAB4311414.1 unnamed protein product [Prunus armeniaca]